jgi:hypothetical protein
MSDKATSTKLTKAQIRAMKWLANTSLDGMCGRGATLVMLGRLEEAGYVKYVGWGFCDDDWLPHKEYPIFAITDSGRALMAEMGLCDK